MAENERNSRVTEIVNSLMHFKWIQATQWYIIHIMHTAGDHWRCRGSRNVCPVLENEMSHWQCQIRTVRTFPRAHSRACCRVACSSFLRLLPYCSSSSAHSRRRLRRCLPHSVVVGGPLQAICIPCVSVVCTFNWALNAYCPLQLSILTLRRRRPSRTSFTYMPATEPAPISTLRHPHCEAWCPSPTFKRSPLPFSAPPPAHPRPLPGCQPRPSPSLSLVGCSRTGPAPPLAFFAATRRIGCYIFCAYPTNPSGNSVSVLSSSKD